jgi:hypothetical protein
VDAVTTLVSVLWASAFSVAAGSTSGHQFWSVRTFVREYTGDAHHVLLAVELRAAHQHHERGS